MGVAAGGKEAYLLCSTLILSSLAFWSVLSRRRAQPIPLLPQNLHSKIAERLPGSTQKLQITVLSRQEPPERRLFIFEVFFLDSTQLHAPKELLALLTM